MSLPLPSGLSPSKVSSFKECALAFKFSVIDRVPEPPAAHLAKGTLVHRALELLFCEAPAHRTLDAALGHLVTARQEVLAHPENEGLQLDDEAAFDAEAEQLVRNYFELEDPTAVNAIGLELRLEAQLGSLRLRGIIDRLDLDGNGDLVVVDYKGLAIDTPLPTPTGWTTMGEVQVGELLLGADGSPTQVIEKSATHYRPCYRIEFDDASSIVCDNEHLWSVNVGWRPKHKVLNADELFELWQAGIRPITIPNAASLDLPAADLPVDPYLLGTWLGDGNSRSGVIHVCDEDVEHFTAALTARGERVRDVTSPSEAARGMRVLSLPPPNPDLCIRGHADRRPSGLSRGRCRRCDATGRWEFPTNSGLRRRLKALGLELVATRGQTTKIVKSVPDVYLRASRDQRLDLLRGLMDTDGYWNGGRAQAVFSTVRPSLAAAVADLVCGLGARAYTYSEPYTNAKGESTKFQVIFTPVGFNPFTLPRKADACVVRDRPLQGARRAIRQIERVLTVPTQCVAVDAPDALYLAGRQMVPTHNTGNAGAERYDKSRLSGVQFYAFLCEQFLGRRPARVQLLHLREPLSITSVPTDQSIRGLTQRTEAVWSAVERACERDDFRPRPSPLCDFCAFREWCPAWGGDPAAAPKPDAMAPALA